MKLQGSYLGFTDNIKGVKRARIESTLDTMLRYDNYGVLKRKEFILQALLDGNTIDKEENYTYYSARIDDYTKPRTLYKMVLKDQDGLYYEITKTEYEFAKHIISNGFTDREKVLSFIRKEKETYELQEKERLEKERIEREEQERCRQIKEDENRRIMEQKRKAWITKGNEIISNFENSPITDVLEAYWPQVKELYPDLSKVDYLNKFTGRFIETIGNINYSIHCLQSYVENERKDDISKINYSIRNNPSMFLEREVLMKVYNVSFDDLNISITAKVKAVHENREYKGKAV